jgi:integrase
MSWRFRFKYGVDQGEVEAFVSGSPCAREYLAKFKGGGVYWGYARCLCMFFKWLRMEQGLSFSPEQFLDTLDKKRSGARGERIWAKSLILAFSRDNPDLAGRSDRTKYLTYFIPLKGFCDYHELPITAARGIFGKVQKRKFTEPAFTVDFARRVLGALNQRDRAVGMVALQAGQSIGQVLGDISGMKDYVFNEIDAGKSRIRVDFPERKGNDYPYFSFISVDAIQELQKWRSQRNAIVSGLGHDPPWLFITKTGQQYTEEKFLTCFRERLTRHKIYTGPLSARSHMFRKIFEQEASPPERGISRLHVAFMMGHASSQSLPIGKLDLVGGVYDKSPFVNPRVVENEYAKLEPYINIYSMRPAGSTTTLSENGQRFFEKFEKVMDLHPEVSEKFEKFLLDL